MSDLDEFRRLNDLIKTDEATEAERARWALLKAGLIESTLDITPPKGTQPVKVGHR